MSNRVRSTNKIALSDADAIGKIRSYIDHRPGRDEDEISRDLQIPLAQVRRVLERLINDGYIESY